ncbi:FxsA family protein [Myxococcota bacterium]|nr:FxsA family protein [Myxococcota bacterium]
MSRLVALFVLVPMLELALLIEVGRIVGTLGTLALIFCTGIGGATLARRQGLRTLGQIQRDLQGGRLPGDALIDGALILLAGALLVTPGVLTDLFGFACLIPGTRDRLKEAVRKRLDREVQSGRIHVNTDWTRTADRTPPVVDVDARPSGPFKTTPSDPEVKPR